MNELSTVFQQINSKFFHSSLPEPELRWNSRLRSCAGRFFSGSRKFPFLHKPKIEIASYLKTEENSEHLILDTMAHEVAHYALWVARKPYGHTADFYKLLNKMGASRFNPVPKRRAVKYFYQCPHCKTLYPARRKWKSMACLKCCVAWNNGRYDPRFKLTLTENRNDIL